MSEKWPAMALAVLQLLLFLFPLLSLLILLLLLLLLDAVPGTHALDQSCEDDDDTDKCVLCCICIDDNYMSATTVPEVDDYGAPAGSDNDLLCRVC